MQTTLLATGLSAKKVLFPALVFVLGFWNIFYSVARLKGQEPADTNVNRPSHHVEDLQKQRLRPTRPVNSKGRQQRVLSKHHSPDKPFLVVHVGPIHTMAGELEEELSELAASLGEDKFALAEERTRASFTSYECHKQLHELRKKFTREQSRGEFGDMDLSTYLSSNCDCWNHALQLLEHHRIKGESLIMIDDSLAGRIFHFDGLWMSAMDLIAIEETLASDWNIEIVVGYRRFAEWLPLAVETNSRQRHRELQAHEKHHNMVVNDDSPLPTPLFPDIVSAAQNGVLLGVNATHTKEVMDRMSFRKDGESKIPVTVFNTHQDHRLAKAFACDILWSAKKTCQAASALPPTRQLLHTDPVQLSDFYEFMVADAYKHTAYRIHEFSTQVAAIAMKYHQEEVLGLVASDLPMECPSKHALQQLLDISLSRERDILPHSAQEQEHQQSFWEMANDPQRLCKVSWKLIMRQSKWRLYIRQLPHKVPKELLPHDATHHHNEAPKANIKHGKFKGRITIKRMLHS